MFVGNVYLSIHCVYMYLNYMYDHCVIIMDCDVPMTEEDWRVGFWVLGYTLLIDDDVTFYFR